VSATSSDRTRRRAPGPKSKTWRRHHDGVRETVESIVVAFVLAFLFRSFEVEAFVIPTGSMAPTLLGRHLDLRCPACGYQFTAGVSVRDDGVIEGIDRPCCANCSGLIPEPLDPKESFKGDRILVVKFPYDLRPPERWDVVVFKFPQDPSKNYIKRLVGLPGELVELHNGDVYIGGQIQRKSLGKIRALRLLVYDNNYIPRGPRWQKRWVPATEGEGWHESSDGHSFTFQRLDSTDRLGRLQYRHWLRDRPSSVPGRGGPGEHWVTDFYAYDSTSRIPLVRTPIYPVDDLVVTFDVEVLQPSGRLVCEIVESREGGGADGVRAVFHLETRELVLWRGDRVLGRVADVRLPVGRKIRIEFTNVDSQAIVALDGQPVGPPLPYDPEWSLRATAVEQDAVGPMRPVALGAANTRLRISNLKVDRDIYYRQPLWQDAQGCRPPPARWQLTPEEFFVLGDNSPSSQDSREWHDPFCRAEAGVPTRYMIGKALLIYWPHGVPFTGTIPLLNFRLFYPHFSRMGLIR